MPKKKEKTLVEIMNGKVQKAKSRIGKKAYEELLKIASQTGLMPEDREDLDTHNSDSEDFFDTAVWSVNEALQRAYELGLKHGKESK